MRSWPGSSARGGFRSSLYLLGLTYQGFGGVLLAFAFLAFLWREDARGFALAALLGFGLGRLLQALGHPEAQPRRAEVFASVALLWLAVPLLGAVPYWVSGGLGYLDALFEAVSGFTTTGATVLTDFGRFGQSLFLWRGFTQWMGGIGIVLLFLVVFPQLQVAGRQAFFAEATGVEKEKLTPRLRHTAQAVLRVYLLLTALAFLAYLGAGVPAFEALANALATTPAGGFSPNPQSFAAYPPLAHWAGSFFMFLAGVNFILQYRLLFGREVGPLLRDPEFRAYGTLTLLAGALLASTFTPTTSTARGKPPPRLLPGGFHPHHHGLRQRGLRRVGGTRPGGAGLPHVRGGERGLGAGGIKVVRWLLLFGFLRREITRTLHPQAVLPLRLGARVVSEEALRQVSVFVFLYTAFRRGNLALALLEKDFVVAFTASAQAIGNIGPGLGPVGPMALTPASIPSPRGSSSS